MNRNYNTIAYFAFLIMLCAASLASATANPPPDFGDDYTLPKPQVPEAPPDVMTVVDLAVLAACLALSAYLSLKKRARTGLFLLGLFCLGYFGFFRHGCICPIGAIQNVTMMVFQSDYVASFTIIMFFVLPILFALFFGRVFCGAVCPLGAIQDLVTLRPLRVPAWLQSALSILAFVYLGLAVLFAATGSAFIICRYDPFVSFFRMNGSFNMILLGVSFLAVGIFVGRPYCRFFCPYGVILNLGSTFSKWRLKISPTECIQCRLCEDACPYGAIKKPSDVTHPGGRTYGKGMLALLCVLLPVFILLGGYTGNKLHVLLSKSHPTVALAERVMLESAGEVKGTTDASDAFRTTGRSPEDLYTEARGIQEEFALGATILGIAVGCVAGFKMIRLFMRRKRTEYEADKGECLSCGRCFSSCPVEQKRRKEKKESRKETL